MSKPASDFLNFALTDAKGNDLVMGTLKEVRDWARQNLGKNGFPLLDDDWEKEEDNIPAMFLLHGNDTEIIELTLDQTRQFLIQLLEL